jgi:hypothetical protein
VQELTRRGFVIGAGGGVIGLGLFVEALGWLRAAGEAHAQAGLGLLPDDPEVRKTMAAIADTVVPGPAGGADPNPGAIEAGALEEMYDPFYGVSPVFPVLHNDLLLETPRILGRPARFELALPYEDRAKVLRDRMAAPGNGGQNPNFLLYQGAAILTYIAYYGTARSELGPEYIGFPPRSTGYWPKHSYRVRFRRMTRRGNYR